MLKHNVEPIAGHLFCTTRPPFDILAQDLCRGIEEYRGKYMAYGPKVTLLKVLSDTLFANPSGNTSFTRDNTLLIDDSPVKSVCNENGNAIFLDTWSHGKRRDNVLLGDLLPWLQRLHSDCPPGQLRAYVDAHRIGLPPLDASDYTMKDVMEAMRKSADNVGSTFELPGIGVVIEPRHRRA
jgi:hypothetical protein